jgi:hypothetical protein
MEDKERPSALLSALTTEHFVLQTASSTTVSESVGRASIYMFSLSSSLVAMGFTSQSPEAFGPFLAAVLPAVFLLGLFTVIRLVDVTLEYRQYLAGIAHIRGYYRTLAPEAAEYFAPERGRWPEAPSTPSLQLGTSVGFLTTTATMVAFINNIVAGAGVTLLARALLGPAQTLLAVLLGVAAAAILVAVFFAYQRWRFGLSEPAVPRGGPSTTRGPTNGRHVE